MSRSTLPPISTQGLEGDRAGLPQRSFSSNKNKETSQQESGSSEIIEEACDKNRRILELPARAVLSDVFTCIKQLY